MNQKKEHHMQCLVRFRAPFQADEIHGAILQERGILYAPDFLINAGGL
jgi:glutamate dehydrogenase/leucine dehydrogenase